MLNYLYVHVRNWADDSGATALEYAVLVAFIAIVIIAGVTLFGKALSDYFATLFPALPVHTAAP